MNYSSYPNAGLYYIEDRQVSYTEFQEYMRTHTRVGREQREQYTEHLTQMYMDEYLNAEEFNDRHTKAMNAVTESDLYTLVMDLPRVPDKPKEVTKPAESAGQSLNSVLSQQPAEVHRNPNLPLRWSWALFASLTLLCVPCPLAAHIYHGLGNSPAFPYAIALIVGALGTLISGIGTLLAWIDS